MPDRIKEERGWTNRQLSYALEEHKDILEYMIEKKINNYKEISQIVRRFALDPGAVVSEVGESNPVYWSAGFIPLPKYKFEILTFQV